MSERYGRNKFRVVYCGCREIQKKDKQNFAIIKGNEKIIEYVEKSSLCAVPGPVSRLMNAEQIVCWQMWGKLLKNKFFPGQKSWQKG